MAKNVIAVCFDFDDTLTDDSTSALLAKHGDRAGRQFWGCSNFAKTHCNFIRDAA